MGLAAVGMLNPLFAAFIHVSSELAFILNSARLLPGVSKRRWRPFTACYHRADLRLLPAHSTKSCPFHQNQQAFDTAS
jgi:hypothetical protein